MVARAGALRAARVVHSLWTETSTETLPGGGRLGTDCCLARSFPGAWRTRDLTSVVDALAQHTATLAWEPSDASPANSRRSEHRRAV